MIFKLKILLLLLPTLLISNEWEKVDLPNLNNGKVLSYYKLDSIYVLEKQDSSIIVSTDLIKWTKLDSSKHKPYIWEQLYYKFDPKVIEHLKKIEYQNSWSTYSYSGLLYFNQQNNTVTHEVYVSGVYKKKISYKVSKGKTKAVQSLDNYLYFIDKDTLYTLDSAIVSKVKIDDYLYKASFIASIHHKGKHLINTITRGSSRFYEVKNDSLIRIDKNNLTNVIRTLFYESKTLSELSGLIEDIKGELTLPNNTFIDYYWVKNKILMIFPFKNGKGTFLNLNTMKVIESSDSIDNAYMRWNSPRIGNYYINIYDNCRELESKIVIYDSNFNEIKVTIIKHKEIVNNNYYHCCLLLRELENYIILSCGGDYYKINLNTLEFENLFSAPYSNCYFSNDLIIKHEPHYNPDTGKRKNLINDSTKNEIIFSYSIDRGKNWVTDSLYGRISDNAFSRIESNKNSHKLDVVGKTIYSFTKDTIFTAELGQNSLKSLLYGDIDYPFHFRGNIYVLDYNTDTIYVLHEKGKYTSIKCPIDNVIMLENDNGTLYVANNRELFRLKLE